MAAPLISTVWYFSSQSPGLTTERTPPRQPYPQMRRFNGQRVQFFNMSHYVLVAGTFSRLIMETKLQKVVPNVCSSLFDTLLTH